MTLNLMGQLAVRQGYLDNARRCLREALRVAREVGNVRRLSFSLFAVASLAKARGEPALAVRLDGAAQAAAASVGTARARPARASADAEMAAARAALGERAVEQALAWLGDDGQDRTDESDLARWQASPWTVFGWTAQPGGTAGLSAPRTPVRTTNGGVHVYGEGGVGTPR